MPFIRAHAKYNIAVTDINHILSVLTEHFQHALFAIVGQDESVECSKVSWYRDDSFRLQDQDKTG